MQQHPLVSIVIPVYKAEAFVKDTVLSLLNQTYDNIEMLFVDDGTPDKSCDVIRKTFEEFGETSKRYSILSYGRNVGPGYARNYGVDHANGDYILFVDADDTIPTDTVESMINAAVTTGADITVGNWRIWEEIDGKRKQQHTAFHNAAFASPWREGKYFFIHGVPCNKLIKRDYLINSGVRFESKILWEDSFWLYNLQLRSFSACQIGTYTYDYILRIGGGSTMNSYTLKHLLSSIALAVWSAQDSYKPIPADLEYFRFNKIVAFRNGALLNLINGVGGFNNFCKLSKFLRTLPKQKVPHDSQFTLLKKLRWNISRLPRFVADPIEYLIIKHLIIPRTLRHEARSRAKLTLPEDFFEKLPETIASLRM